MADFEIKVENNQLIVKVEKITKGIIASLAKAMTKISRNLTTHIKDKHLTGGTTDTKLRVRTGHLRSLTTHLPTKVEGDKIRGGVQFGAKYSGVHIGARGKVTTITARNAKLLTIPLPPALTQGGRMKFPTARDYPNLFFYRSKSGEMFLMRAKRGELTPFFLLKRSVRVKTRVHPKEILQNKKSEIKNIIVETVQRGVAA